VIEKGALAVSVFSISFAWMCTPFTIATLIDLSRVNTRRHLAVCRYGRASHHTTVPNTISLSIDAKVRTRVQKAGIESDGVGDAHVVVKQMGTPQSGSCSR
jgi:hypothetical protein